MSQAGTQSMDTNPLLAQEIEADRKRLLKQAGYHLVAYVSAIALWAAADSWYLISGLPVAVGVAVLASLVFGVALSHMTHEWFHFLGARLSRSVSPVKENPAFLMFDFDYTRNNYRQFLFMGIAGSVGNWLLVLLVFLAIPLDSPGRAMLLAATIAMGIYVAVLEFPVLANVIRKRDPIAALMARFGEPGAISQATWAAVISGSVLWVLLAL